MDHWQMVRVCEMYQQRVEELLKTPLLRDDNCLRHVATMLPQMVVMSENAFYSSEPVKSEQWDKVNRWLGFVQGVLWTRAVYTIDQMREHNRPEGAPQCQNEANCTNS